MKLMNKVVVLSLFLTQFFSIQTINSQNKNQLSIGDVAPEIKYSKWLQGESVSSVKDGKVYVLEFWATWCGACRQAMGHLSELSKKYEGKASFLGVNVMEKTKGQSYETVLPKVMDFINSDLNQMTYPGFADSNDEYMKKNWIEAVGSQGLPSTFVIREGRLIWIGHPFALDGLMDQFIDGTFDVKAFKEQNEEQRAFYEKARVEQMKIDEALNKKDYNKAIELIDAGIAKSASPAYKMQKFKVLADYVSKDKALAYLVDLKNKNDNGAFEIARIMPKREDMTPAIYAVSVEILRQKPVDRYQLSAIAMLLAKIGKEKEAIAEQEKAIEILKLEILADKNNPALQKELREYDNLLKEFKSPQKK